MQDLTAKMTRHTLDWYSIYQCVKQHEFATV